MGFLSFLWLFAVVLGVEVFLRASGFGTSPVAYDTRFGWRYLPHRVLGTPPQRISFNRFGIRDRDHADEKSEGDTRVLFLGDSYVAGLDISDTDILARRFEAKAESFEAINGAVPAWSTDQQLLFFEEIAKGFRPDWVMLVMAPNDVRENYAKHFFALENDRLVERPHWAPSFFERAGFWLTNHSATYLELHRRWNPSSGWTTPFLRGHSNLSFPLSNGTFCGDVHLFEPTLREPLPQAVLLTEALIERLRVSVETAGSRLAITVLPTKLELKRSASAAFRPGAISSHFLKFARDRGIPALDLHAALNAHDNPLSNYLTHDFHFSAQGHDWLAEELAEFFIARTRPVLTRGAEDLAYPPSSSKN